MVAILVLLAILFMVTVDVYIIRKKRLAEANMINASPEVFTKNSMLAPAGYFFSKGHTWLKKGNGNEIITGIDDFILKSLGRIHILKFVSESTFVKKGDVIMEGKFDSKTVSFRSPINGVVKKVNNNLIGKYVTDPYNNDWGVVIEPEKNESLLEGFLKDSKAANWMKDEFKKLKEFLIYNQDKPMLAGVTMYDGGNVITGAVAHMDQISLKDFEEMFLTV